MRISRARHPGAGRDRWPPGAGSQRSRVKSGTTIGSALLLAACSPGNTADAAATSEPETIPCAIGGATAFATCSVERSAGEGDEEILVIRHPHGGFRRLMLSADGEIATADGADEAVGKPVGETLEVTIAGDRYRFPVEADVPRR